MSHKAIVVTDAVRIERFDYATSDAPPSHLVTPSGRPRSVQMVPPGPVTLSGPPGRPQLVSQAAAAPAAADRTVEREAFAQGYAQGERAGMEAAARQLQTQQERVAQTLTDLADLREDLTYRTERQVVELALAVAARILHREVSLDRELLLVMARIAIDRIGDLTMATIRLHPDDEAAARGVRDSWPGGSVVIVADPAIRPGGCLVQTAQGQIELGVDAQLKELAASLLGEVPQLQPVGLRDE